MSNNVNSVVRRSVPCYFCNEFLEERYLSEHVKHCGAVLEECPHKCGVYVPRRNMESHERSCEKKITKRNSQVHDSLWKNKVFSVLTLLRSAINEGENERRNLQGGLTRCSKLLQSQQESLDALRFHFIQTTEECRQYNVTLNERLSEIELTCDNMEQRTSLSFQQISEQLKLLQGELTNEQNKHDDVLSNWCMELKDLRTFLAKESMQMTSMWQEQQQLIHDLKLELEMRCKDSKGLATVQEKHSERIDALNEEIQKQSEEIAEQKTRIKGLKFQTKENLQYVEELIRDSSVMLSRSVECDCAQECYDRVPTDGRLLWRIDRYKERMTEAKESNCRLYSPRFSNKSYGYTLRLELFLNGIGQWKDRHIIGCLKVENGKWDPLLDWPCILKASVTLRNQEDPANDIKKIVKTVGHDKTDSVHPDKESGIYMFIPHTTLTRYSGYTKNNVLFLDVQVKDIKTSVSTASLVS